MHKSTPPLQYVLPQSHKEYRSPEGYKGIPINAHKKYVNLENPFKWSYPNILRWLPGHMLNLIKNARTQFPVVYNSSDAFLKEDNCIMWLGHASFYLRINGIRILIDPQFNHAVCYFRHSKFVTDPHFFKSVDLILVSHNHADHCDKASLKLLFKNNPQATLLTGLGMDTLLQDWTGASNKIVCLEWYEGFNFESLKIFFVPSQHYSKRIGTPFCSSLWGGFILESQTGFPYTVYFGGDSGYAQHFKDIGHLFHPDIALMGIGAYAPHWFMKPNHASPQQAYQAFKDCGARKMVPMHYQTFNLSNEPMQEPLQKLTELTKANPHELAVLTPGKLALLKTL